METETSHISNDSQRFPLIIRIKRLSGIFNNHQTMTFGNIYNGIHLTSYTGIMNRNNTRPME